MIFYLLKVWKVVMKMKHPPVSSLTLNFSSVCNLLTLCNKIILKFYCLKGFHNRCKVSVVKFEKKKSAVSLNFVRANQYSSFVYKNFLSFHRFSQDYIGCAEAWIEYVCKNFTVSVTVLLKVMYLWVGNRSELYDNQPAPILS